MADAAGRWARDRGGRRLSHRAQAPDFLLAVREGITRPALSAVLALSPVLALAGQPALSPGSGGTVDDAVRLFQSACLANHPDFQGSNAVLDETGFVRPETAVPWLHSEKALQAIVMPLMPDAYGGARSCTVIAAGIGFSQADTELAPLITEQLGHTERHHDDQITAPHAVWVSWMDDLQTKIILAEQGDALVIAASVAPLQEQGQ